MAAMRWREPCASYAPCAFSVAVPMAWLRGVVVPLHKDGSLQLPSNYRPITLLSIVGKVYTGVLQDRLLRWSESSGLIVAEQGGFRPGRGCPEQLYTLTELIKLRRLRNTLRIGRVGRHTGDGAKLLQSL